jgi:hypothetical protein
MDFPTLERRADMNEEGGGLLTWWNLCVSHARRGTLLAGFFALALLTAQPARAQTGIYSSYNIPPYAQNDFSMTVEEMPTTIALLNNDYGMMAPLNPGSVHVVVAPLHGEVMIDPSTGNAWYFPDDGFYGMDAFTYVVSNANGQVSNVATVSIYVMSMPPTIQNLAWQSSDSGVLVFTGQVVDLHPAGIVVTFSGLVNGSVTTDTDGSFSFTATIPAGTSGEVDVQARAADGLLSPVVTEYIVNR